MNNTASLIGCAQLCGRKRLTVYGGVDEIILQTPVLAFFDEDKEVTI